MGASQDSVRNKRLAERQRAESNHRSVGAEALAELRKFGLTFPISEQSAGRIKAELLRIEGLILQGGFRDPNGCISEAYLHATYHAIANEIVDTKTPEGILEEMIPHFITEYGRHRQWLNVHNVEYTMLQLEGSIMEWRGKRLYLFMGPKTDEMGVQKASPVEPNEALLMPICRTKFPKRAVWLDERLKERSWNKNDLSLHGGPDRKTVFKILCGEKVREDILEKLASALSTKSKKVSPIEIPSD